MCKMKLWQIAALVGLGLIALTVCCLATRLLFFPPSHVPTRTPAPSLPTRTPAPSLPAGTEVELTGEYGISVWYMYEDRCKIDVAHHYVPPGTRAIVASSKVCYADNPFEAGRSYYYKVKIPSLDYSVENCWVKAEHIKVLSK